MRQYLSLVSNVLEDGSHRPNRTAVDTVSTFGEYYEVDLRNGFPLLTTKRMSDRRWRSLVHELLWYVSGEHHIRALREETSIWDAWADDEWNLPSAYGRFWRRYPVPDDDAQLPGEAWVGEDCPWVSREGGTLVFDQLGYVVDTLAGENPHRGRDSRRLVVNAWHPANAAESGLPPCHYSYVFNVQEGDRLNLHLTQRSGDVALGIPFNIAAYSLVTEIVARRTGLEPGVFAHSVTDAHVYCGSGDRGAWYGDNLDALQARLESESPAAVREWLDGAAPAGEGYDHVPGLLTQLGRAPLQRPRIEIADRPLDDLEFDDVSLQDYDSHPKIEFEVAE